MEIPSTDHCRKPLQPLARPPFIAWAAQIVLRVLRRTGFEALRFSSQFVLPLLLWLAVGGVALWVLFVRVAHDEAFPSASVLGMSLGCVLGALVYCLLMELLRPASR